MKKAYKRNLQSLCHDFFNMGQAVSLPLEQTQKLDFLNQLRKVIGTQNKRKIRKNTVKEKKYWYRHLRRTIYIVHLKYVKNQQGVVS